MSFNKTNYLATLDDDAPYTRSGQIKSDPFGFKEKTPVSSTPQSSSSSPKRVEINVKIVQDIDPNNYDPNSDENEAILKVISSCLKKKT